MLDQKFESRFPQTLALSQTLILTSPTHHSRYTHYLLQAWLIAPPNPPPVPHSLVSSDTFPSVQCPPCTRASPKLYCIQRFELQTTKTPQYRLPRDRKFDALQRRRPQHRHPKINQQQPFSSSKTCAFISGDFKLFLTTSVSPQNGCRGRRCYD